MSDLNDEVMVNEEVMPEENQDYEEQDQPIEVPEQPNKGVVGLVVGGIALAGAAVGLAVDRFVVPKAKALIGKCKEKHAERKAEREERKREKAASKELEEVTANLVEPSEEKSEEEKPKE